ncbi:class I SAM-dependent methyltransferase [Roseovarius sp.]|uniref:class I SAM-dependent methyltransferase n=1 Tax=Roseovarius sp. TaxID=1486281 RepID=UPI0025F36675|nr:class I SAM-dependent methyltransferase [Roseovarius sp.]
MSTDKVLSSPSFTMDGQIRKLNGDGFNLYQYPDYETYKEIQQEGNRRKIDWQFVPQSHIALCAKFVEDTVGPVRFGLCHGTRSGAEQSWFSEALSGKPEVLGTEISDTAKDFPNTVQWDFHDANPDWKGKADFVYSNSWDHAFEPLRAFSSWLESLRPGGVMLLDHTAGHVARKANQLDSFGIKRGRFQRLLRTEFGATAEPMDPLDFTTANPDYPAHVLVMRKR